MKTTSKFSVIIVCIMIIVGCATQQSTTSAISRIDEEDVQIVGTIPAGFDISGKPPSANEVYEASIEEATRACLRYNREPELLSQGSTWDNRDFSFTWKYTALYACIEVSE